MTARIATLLFVLPLGMPMIGFAQALRDVAPLKYWPAPLYWQPTHEETKATTRSELFNLSNNAQPPAQNPANALVFVAMTPCRLVDTRAGFGFTGAFGPPALVGGATRAFPLQTSATCSIPTSAQAYSLNITIVPPGQMFYLTIWPLGSSQPNVSTQNDLLGTVIANAAIVPAGNDAGSGSVNVFVSNNTDLIIDINGYYAPQTGITVAQGTTLAPSISFAGDPSTGVYSSGAGILNASVSGEQALSIGGAANTTAVGIGALAVTTGTNNTAVGYQALQSNTTGNFNTASGGGALTSNTTGCCNTANGSGALFFNTTGHDNLATGFGAMAQNTTGHNNTASGGNALGSNTTGNNNTASGNGALGGNTTGNGNTAAGYQALQSNTTGGNNTADGVGALFSNTVGNFNTASGWLALNHNSNGTNNTANGQSALTNNTSGNNNTAIGQNALSGNSTGGNDIAVGFQAALNVSGANSNNIHIGSEGASGDSGVVKIGTSGTQTSFFAAGVRGITTANNDAVPVVIDSNGQLGTVSSSIRFKEDVHDMADASSHLLQLRPVTYRYKQPYADGSKPVDYGLIAEEVAEVYPDLVVKNADGQVETVQYQKLTPMLLNELQKQHQQMEQQKAEQERVIQRLESRLAAMEALLAGPTPAR